MDWQIIVNEALEHSCITSAELAKRCGVAKSWMHQVANGKIKNPSFERGAAIINFHPHKDRIIRSTIKADINDIRSNRPKGATHYIHDDLGTDYIMINKDKFASIWSYRFSCWLPFSYVENIDEFTPLSFSKKS